MINSRRGAAPIVDAHPLELRDRSLPIQGADRLIDTRSELTQARLRELSTRVSTVLQEARFKRAVGDDLATP
ncbi:MAG: hypothetical protein AAF735_05850 [Myxococcota bacterium]